MKITDVSSLSESPQLEDPGSSDTASTRKLSLLERYNIQVEELDFDHVSKCNDAHKVERILLILRSGEEGVYPELEACVVKRLEELNPKSKELRVATPAIRSSEMEKEERDEISTGLTDWLKEFVTSTSKLGQHSIFDGEDKFKAEDFLENCSLPVRGSQQAQITSSTKVPKQEERIKSSEYDKWDKFDVDKEITKMDICDMQREEWEKREKPRLIQEQKEIEKLMKPSSNF